MAAILQAFINGKWVEIPALQGEDGYSPTVTVADEGDKISITVKDKNGEKTISYAKGAGDMLKSVYDADGDGVVDQAKSATTAETATNAEKLGNELPSAYRKTADQIDYLTEVQNKPTIDTAVTEGSGNAVSGGAVKTYVDGKVGDLASYPRVTSFNVPTAQHNNGTNDLTPPYTFPLMVDNVGANDVIDVRVDYDSTLILEDKATYREAMRNAIISVDSMVDMGEGSYVIYLVCDGEFPTTITNMVFKIINYGAGVTA